MPSKSKAQQKFMGMVHALKKGEMNPKDASSAVKKAAKSMSKKSVKKYASTKHRGKPVKVSTEWLEQIVKELTNTEMESCGYTTSAVDPKYKLKSPGGTGPEDKKLKEESTNEQQYFNPKGEFKKYMDKVFKQAGIKVIKYDPMKQNFYNGAWGGFYTVKSSNKVDMPGQGKVKRSSAVIPVYISRVGEIELGVSAGGFHIGKVGSSQVLKNLKDFKKSDLTEYVKFFEAINASKIYKIYDSLKKGDIVSIKYDSSIARGSKFHPFLVTKGKTKLMKGKIERIILIPADTKNKKAKRYLYNRNGSISFALGDMAASIVDMKKGNINEIKKLYHKTQIKNAVQIAKKMSGNMTGAVKKIEKLSKGLSKTNTVKDALRKYNESLNEARLDPKQLLQQLGGNRFIAMTGAKNLAVDKAKNTLHMKIGRNSKGVSHLRIKLTGADLYDMEFLQVRAGNVKVKSKEKGVYADQLQKLFTKNTGMYTSL